MKITILGSGTMLPTKRRFPASVLIETAKTKMLLDCGHGTLARLTEVDLDPRELDAVVVSHFHPDHFSDTFPFVATRAVGDSYENKEHQLLTMVGPEKIKKRFMDWMETAGLAHVDYPIDFYEGVLEHKLKDISIKTFPITHVADFQYIGIRLTVNSKSLFYTGDISPDQNIQELARYAEDADLLIIESGEETAEHHFATSSINKIAQLSQVKQVVVSHVSITPGDEERLQKFVKDNGHTLAEDKMVIEL